jgi:hypothetical protein
MKFIESIFLIIMLSISIYVAHSIQEIFKFSIETLILTFIILYISNARKTD